jgi:fatty-acyl-CoA synthase
MSLLRRMAAGAIVARSNTTPFERPDRLPRAMLAMAPWGASLPGVVAAAAARYPERSAIVDDDGSVTYDELWSRARSVAAGLTELGAAPGTTIGILGRNHRGFAEWLVGAAATGAHVTLMNTGFAGPQLADVVEHEGVSLLLHDDEFADVAAASGVPTVDETAATRMAAAGRTVRPTRHQGRLVILTSGTTGTAQGGGRSSGSTSIEGIAAVLDAIPLRLGDVQVVPAPLFHAWGLSHLTCSAWHGVRPRSWRGGSIRRDPRPDDPSTGRRARRRSGHALPLAHRRRLVAHAGLRVIASSGSALGAKLSTDVLERFGPVLYNLYGSTEVAVATVAPPTTCAAPRAPPAGWPSGCGSRSSTNRRRPCRRARPDASSSAARCASTATPTAGQGVQRGLLSTGDLGHLDERGLLFVEGRDDDMIVSGGENVFPPRSRSCSRATPPSPTSPWSACPTTSSVRCWPPTSCPPTPPSSAPTTSGATCAITSPATRSHTT